MIAGDQHVRQPTGDGFHLVHVVVPLVCCVVFYVVRFVVCAARVYVTKGVSHAGCAVRHEKERVVCAGKRKERASLSG